LNADGNPTGGHRDGGSRGGDVPESYTSAHDLVLSYEIPIEKTSRFWDELREGKVLTTSCRECGEVFFPPQADCPECMSSDVKWIELSGQAKLEAYTEINIPPNSFKDKAAYIVGIGRLEEGISVLAWIVEADLKEIEVGMDMRLVVRKTADERAMYFFRLE
jgi:hypothetical protein